MPSTRAAFAGRFVKKVREAILRYSMIQRNDTVVAAVSGGPDSVSLLLSLLQLRESLGFRLAACHLDHRFRGEESAQDARFVMDLCAARGITCEVASRDVRSLAAAWGVGFEEAGRRARYEFYEEVAARLGASRVALGHTMDDQAETVLMRLIRGSGAEGLSGIPPVRGMYIRPLLFISRREVERYCAAAGVTPRTDATNLQPLYFRNQVRLEALPRLEKWNPRLRETLAATADRMREDASYMETAAAAEYRRLARIEGMTVTIDRHEFLSLHAALRRRLVRAVAREGLGTADSMAFDHIDAVLNLAARGGPGKALHLPGGIVAELGQECLVFRVSGAGEGGRPYLATPIPIRVPGFTPLVELGAGISVELSCGEGALGMARENRDPNVACIDYGAVDQPLTVRSKADGDYFYPLGLGGRKKVGDFMTSMKIPVEARGSVPIVLSGDQIVWVAGYRIDDRFKVTDSTRAVIVMRLLHRPGEAD